jgi:pilus assembly protein Flp/PilA
MKHRPQPGREPEEGTHMVDLVTKTAVRTRIAVRDWVEDRVETARSRRPDAGQTAIEYLGIAVIIAAIILALSGTDIGGKIKDGIMSMIDKVLGAS